MEKVLKGHIKSLTKGFGFIFCISENQDYFFNQITQEDNNTSLKIGDFVSFKLQPNTGRKGYHAIDITSCAEIDDSFHIQPKRTNSKYHFDSQVDMAVGLNYIREKFEKQRSKCKENYKDYESMQDDIDQLLFVVSDLLDGPSPNIENLNFEEINNSEVTGIDIKRTHKDYWNKNFNLKDFGHQVEYISSKEVDKGMDYDFSIIWHEWKANQRQYFYKGYKKGHFNYSFIEKGAKEQVSVYDTPPPIVRWELKEIEQKGQVFYIAKAKVNEIAQSSSVPALPPILGIVETADRILNKNRKSQEWQREIDPQRVRKIASFIEGANNIIANTPLLYIHDSNSVKIVGEKTKELVIDFSSFLMKQTSGEFAGKYIDRELLEKKDEFGNDIYVDHRPFWIIDGQHRVRGINLSDENQELEIPIIVFPKGFEMSNTAKVFAEINTLQKKLNPLHELYMQHRFSIDHVVDKRNFRPYESIPPEQALSEGWIKHWVDSRANHLAYEVLAMLAKKGPLKDRVQFLPQNEEKDSIYVGADIWLNYARTLFSDGCYKYKRGQTEDYINNPTNEEKKARHIELFYEELNNYFKAWVSTCNHGEFQDREPRWLEEGRNGKALIQKKTHFVILIELYDLIRGYAFRYKKKNRLSGIIKEVEFMEILKPFKWLDWKDPRVSDTFPGSGERGRRSLEVWMADAIINGVQISEKRIMNDKDKSLPGQGLLAELGRPSLEIISKIDWPTKKSPVKFQSTRPWNARYESIWRVEEKSGKQRGEFKKQVSRHSPPMYAEFILKHEKYMDDPAIKELVIRVDWKNSLIVTGFSKIVIRKK